MNPRRQAFEVSLLTAIAGRRDMPVLGVCLGMQMMALCAGGKLDQYLPQTLGEDRALLHQGDRTHAIVVEKSDSVLGAGASDTVRSWHRQAVSDAGSLRVVARAPDGVVEAIDDPTRRFYLGVQWHPERGEAADALSGGLIARFVAACLRGA
jgi:putative glutamine amidotransferase